MDFSKLAEYRYSLRKFDHRPIEKEKLDLILRAARLSPTACNNQPQRILVIESKDALEKVRGCTPYHFGAPMVLLVCFEKTSSWVRSFDGKNSGDIDASIVTTHMMLQAADLGLGTTWVGHFDPSLIIKAFSLGENLIPVALLPIGYPAAQASPHPLHEQRLAIEETVFYNHF